MERPIINGRKRQHRPKYCEILMALTWSPLTSCYATITNLHLHYAYLLQAAVLLVVAHRLKFVLDPG